MKKRSTSKDDQDIPEYTREQLGVGVRGKHYKQFMQGSNEIKGVGDADARNVRKQTSGALQGEVLVREPQGGSETVRLKAPVSHSKDPDLQKVPQALVRTAEKARQLAEQTGTPFVSRKYAKAPAKAEKQK